MYKQWTATLLILAIGSLLSSPKVFAAKTIIAVAANFSSTAKDIAEAFTQQTGHKAVLSFGSTGKLYAQIANGAPFDVFLAADSERPQKAERSGLAVKGSRFTYATGKIVLYSKEPTLVDNNGRVLTQTDNFARLAIANPQTAPYGAAAIAALQSLNVYQQIKDKIVQGENIAQAYQFIDSGNAQLGFVALSQVISDKNSSQWIVPEQLYPPVQQDAVLLQKGSGNQAARAFIGFLKTERCRTIITKYGYGSSPQ